MNFKLNALVAAVLMVAAASANAKIADSNDNTLAVPHNSGDLFFDLVSESNNASYTADLGLTLDQFAAAAVNADGVKLVWDLDAGTFSDLSAVSTGLVTQTLNYGSIYTTFATTAVVTDINLKFDIKAMDGTPSAFPTAGTNRYLSTSAATFTQNNGQIFAMDNWDVITGAANNDQTNSTHGADLNTAGANMFDLGDEQNAYFQAAGDQWNGATSFQSTGTVNDLAGTTYVEGALNFFFLSNTSSNSASQATVTQYEGVWTFDETTAQLIYSTTPVPEAETYAMMLAGLGLVGFMVRRRRNLV